MSTKSRHAKKCELSALTSVNQAALWGAILMFLAIAIGAFGSHALADHLQQQGSLVVFEIANRYHFYHALGLLICALLWSSDRSFKWQKHCSILMLVGTVLFSGSLYILAITGISAVGVVTPLGGLFLLGAWGLVISDLLIGTKSSESGGLTRWCNLR